MTNTLNIIVTFKDKTIPQDRLNLLSHDAENLVLDHFADKLREVEGIKPKTPYTFIQSEFLAKTLALAKKAFDQHRISPYPNDEAQVVLGKIAVLAQKSLAGAFGPTAVQNLHPKIDFT